MASPVWILAGLRTGSTNLCEALNSTRLFEPGFYEHFNREISAYPRWFVEPPPYTKVLDYNFRNLCGKGYNVIKMGKHHLPGLRLVLLQREDLIGTAVSSYIASMSDVWAIFTGANSQQELARFQSMRFETDKSLLLKFYGDAEKSYAYWPRHLAREHLEPWLKVDYEEIVSDLREVVSQILRVAGHRLGRWGGPGCIKQTHPQTEELRQVLCDLVK